MEESAMQVIGTEGKFGVTDGARTRDNQNHNHSHSWKENSILAEICGIFSGFWPEKNQELARPAFRIFGRIFAPLLATVLALPSRAEPIYLTADYTVLPFFDERTTAQALHEAAVVMEHLSGKQITLVDDSTPAGEGLQCTVSFVVGSAALSVDIVGQTQLEPACTIRLRVDAFGARTPRRLRCLMMHELGHVLMGDGWHSEYTDSVMYAKTSGRCVATADFLAQLQQ